MTTDKQPKQSELNNASENAKRGVGLLFDLIYKRFGDEGLSKLEQYEKEFEEKYSVMPDEERIGHIQTWALEGAKQDQWETIALEDSLELLCRLKAMRDFIDGSLLLLKKDERRSLKERVEKKKKIKAKLAKKSRQANRKK